MKVRKEVVEFSKAMEKILRENDHKGGWQDEDLDYLIDGIKTEYRELCKYWKQKNYPNHNEMSMITKLRLMGECTDIANFAMMVYDKILKA